MLRISRNANSLARISSRLPSNASLKHCVIYVENNYVLRSLYARQIIAPLCTTPTRKDEPKEPLSLHFNLETKAEPKRSKVEIVVGGLASAGKSIKDIVMNPRATWQSIKHEVNHYYMGSKLLWSEIKITKDILARVVQGYGMTRRERKQLIRTTTDIFRLVPFAIFVIVPFLELALPFFLKFFPNMLPSTFQDSLKKEEFMKKELQMRLSVAKFMQETLQEMARKSSAVEGEEKAMATNEIIDFIHKTQQGQPVPTETVLRIARLFRDDLTLDNISRPQLVSLCTYMGLQSYGSDILLRFLLRNKIRKIKEDDRRILWEGVESLNTLELREACRERGMRSLGLTQFQLKHQLTEWLELSTHQNVPISLLIMSRALTLSAADELPTQVLQSSLSSLDSDTINEVVLASATGTEEDSIDMRKRKLESLKFQQEMIDEERATVVVVEADDAANAVKGTVTTLQGKEVPVAVTAAKTEEGKVVITLPSDQLKETVVVIKPEVMAIPSVSAVMATAVKTKTPTATTPAPPSVDVTTEGKEQEEMATAAETVPAPVSPPKKKELTLEEMQALVDLARGSSLQREKSELSILQATIESVLGGPAPARAPKTTTDTEHADSSAVEAISSGDGRMGRSVSRMRSVLNDMIKKLEVKIDTTEKVVGDKFNVLDKDGDGQLTAHELKEAIVQLMRREFSLQEADQMVDLLDDDKDGKVSLVELLHFIEEQKESLEMQALQAPPSSVETLPPETTVGSRLVTAGSD